MQGGQIKDAPAWWYPTPTRRHRSRFGGVALGRSARNWARFEAELPLLNTVARSLIVKRSASHICATSVAVCSTFGRVPQKMRTDLCSCTPQLELIYETTMRGKTCGHNEQVFSNCRATRVIRYNSRTSAWGLDC